MDFHGVSLQVEFGGKDYEFLCETGWMRAGVVSGDEMGFLLSLVLIE